MDDEDVMINLPCIRLFLGIPDFHLKKYFDIIPKQQPVVEAFLVSSSVKRALAVAYGKTSDGYTQDVCPSTEIAKKLLMIPEDNKKWVNFFAFCIALIRKNMKKSIVLIIGSIHSAGSKLP